MSETKGTSRATDEAVVAISAARGSRGTALKTVTANRLTDGVVVYFAAGGDWVERIEEACTADGKEAGAALLAEAEAQVAQCRIVGPYLIDVVRDADGVLRAASYRERMRALGPSVRLDLGKQAAEG